MSGKPVEYLAAPASCFPTEDGNFVVSSEISGEAISLGRVLSRLLSKLDAARTLSSHASTAIDSCSVVERMLLFRDLLLYCQENFGELDLGFGCTSRMLERALARLAEKSVLVSEPQVLSRAALGPHAGRSSISTVAIPTCERPELLRRCLESLLPHLRTNGRGIRLLIADDSRSRSASESNRAVLAQFASSCEAEVRLITRADRTAYISELEKCGVPRSAAEFLLVSEAVFENTCGANRNAILLASAGDPLWMLDDDTMPELRYADGAYGSLRLEGEADGNSHRFFTSREAIDSASFSADDNLFAIGEAFIGRTLADLILEPRTRTFLEFGKGARRHLSMLFRGAGEVTAVFPGIYGDSGSNAALYRFFINERDREREFADNERYLASRGTRLVIKGCRCATVVPAGACMSTALCLDNRALLPPFFPVLRNQDAIFGSLLKSIRPSSLFVHVPELIGHFPADMRSVDPDLTFGHEEFFHDTLVDAVLTPLSLCPPASTEAGCRIAGELLANLQAMTPDDYRNFARSHWQSRLVDSFNSLERQQKERGFPPRARADMSLTANKFKELFMKKPVLAPASMCANRPAEEAEEGLRRLVAAFGEALKEWPAITAAARRLRSEGLEIGSKI